MKVWWLSFVLTVASAASAQVPAVPEPARLAKAQEVMRAMRIEETMQKTMDAVLGQSMDAATSQAIAALPDDDGIKDDPEFKAILKRHLDRLNATTAQQMRDAMPELVRGMTTIYARNFTVAQLEDITRFYQTPTGQSFLEKSPELARQSVEVTQSILLPRIMASIPDLSRQMKSEIVEWASKRKPATKS